MPSLHKKRTGRQTHRRAECISLMNLVSTNVEELLLAASRNACVMDKFRGRNLDIIVRDVETL